MNISARVANRQGEHQAGVSTNGVAQSLVIAPKPAGLGSSVNGGELLLLALATCYCNDVYREAAKQGISVQAVEVEVDGEFGAAGEPARQVRYRAKISAQASADAIRALAEATDAVAEIQNTLRLGMPVVFDGVEPVSV